jgi:transcriptional regulator with XRE-family HTH domain
MPRRKRQITYTDSAPAAVEDAVARLGANIATARLRRRLRQQDLAEKAGITRATLAAIEQGRLGTGIGAYVSVLWALGLHADVTMLADPDRDVEGATLEAARRPSRARPATRLDDDF